MNFRNLWVILLIPFILAFVGFVLTNKKSSVVLFSSKNLIPKDNKTLKLRLRKLPFYLRVVVIILFIVALSGPRSVLEQTLFKSEGIDIVLAIDSSGSMQAEDFIINNKRINRLSIVKKVVEEFIDKRTNDNIGLITFAGLAYTVCPLTTDYDWLTANLERIELGQIKDGTAVGSAIASSVSRLKKSKAKSKIIVLLTDGMNNAGEIDPIEAAKIAKEYGIKIYTIGAGKKGPVPVPVNFFGKIVYQNVIIDIDEDTLYKIANLTGGKYYRATDTDTLKMIYDDIDKLEKTKIEHLGYREYKELFVPVLLSALLLLILELVLRNTIFFRVP